MLLQACRLPLDAPSAPDPKAGTFHCQLVALGNEQRWYWRWWQDWNGMDQDPCYRQAPMASSFWSPTEFRLGRKGPTGLGGLGPLENLPDRSSFLIEIAQLMPGRGLDWQSFLDRHWAPRLQLSGGILSAGELRHRRLACRRLLWSLWIPGHKPLAISAVLHPGYRAPGKPLQLLRQLETHSLALDPASCLNPTQAIAPAL